MSNLEAESVLKKLRNQNKKQKNDNMYFNTQENAKQESNNNINDEEDEDFYAGENTQKVVTMDEINNMNNNECNKIINWDDTQDLNQKPKEVDTNAEEMIEVVKKLPKWGDAIKIEAEIHVDTGEEFFPDLNDASKQKQVKQKNKPTTTNFNSGNSGCNPGLFSKGGMFGLSRPNQPILNKFEQGFGTQEIRSFTGNAGTGGVLSKYQQKIEPLPEDHQVVIDDDEVFHNVSSKYEQQQPTVNRFVEQPTVINRFVEQPTVNRFVEQPAEKLEFKGKIKIGYEETESELIRKKYMDSIIKNELKQEQYEEESKLRFTNSKKVDNSGLLMKNDINNIQCEEEKKVNKYVAPVRQFKVTKETTLTTWDE